jgi:hypothetical protein
MVGKMGDVPVPGSSELTNLLLALDKLRDAGDAAESAGQVEHAKQVHELIVRLANLIDERLADAVKT